MLKSLPGKISDMQLSSQTGRYRCRVCSRDSRGRQLIACMTSNDFMGHSHAVFGQVVTFLYIVYS